MPLEEGVVPRVCVPRVVVHGNLARLHLRSELGIHREDDGVAVPQFVRMHHLFKKRGLHKKITTAYRRCK